MPGPGVVRGVGELVARPRSTPLVTPNVRPAPATTAPGATSDARGTRACSRRALARGAGRPPSAEVVLVVGIVLRVVGSSVSSTSSPGGSSRCRVRSPVRAAGSRRRRPGRPPPGASAPCVPGRAAAPPPSRCSGARRHSLTGTGATRRGQPSRRTSRTLPAAGPSPPDSERGRPTTTSTAPVLLDERGRAGRGRPCRGARSRPGSRGCRTGRCARRRCGRPRGRSRGVRRALTATARHRPARPTSAPTSASASSIRVASVPPPWATSSLPPPLPPTSGPTRDQRVGADAARRGPRR